MKTGTVVTLVMSNGAEIIGRLVKEEPMSIVLNRPRMLQATQQGIGLVNGICMSGVEPKGDFEFTKNSVMYMVETAPELASGWTQQTSGIATPPKGCLLYTSPSPRDAHESRMPSSA